MTPAPSRARPVRSRRGGGPRPLRRRGSQRPGIPKYCDVASSWASTRPPALLTAAVPAAPSIPVPERTIAVLGPRWFRASERSRTSALGRTWWTSSEWSRRIVSCSSTSMCASGGATHTTPGSRGAPSTACSTRSFVARSRIAGRTLGASGIRWMMARTDASRSAGRPPRTTWSAPIPPAEPTMATTWVAAGSAVGGIRGAERRVLGLEAHVLSLILANRGPPRWDLFCPAAAVGNAGVSSLRAGNVGVMARAAWTSSCRW